jgi:preprotein translocase subunit SecD
VVLCLGILTSVFTATFVTRGMVNLVYGSRRKLERVPIGQVWIPRQNPAIGKIMPNDNDSDKEIVSTSKRINEQAIKNIEPLAGDQDEAKTGINVKVDNSAQTKSNQNNEKISGKTKSKRKSSNVK